MTDSLRVWWKLPKLSERLSYSHLFFYIRTVFLCFTYAFVTLLIKITDLAPPNVHWA